MKLSRRFGWPGMLGRSVRLGQRHQGRKNAHTRRFVGEVRSMAPFDGLWPSRGDLGYWSLSTLGKHLKLSRYHMS